MQDINKNADEFVFNDLDEGRKVPLGFENRDQEITENIDEAVMELTESEDQRILSELISEEDSATKTAMAEILEKAESLKDGEELSEEQQQSFQRDLKEALAKDNGGAEAPTQLSPQALARMLKQENAKNNKMAMETKALAKRRKKAKLAKKTKRKQRRK